MTEAYRKEETAMACMTLFAQPLARATTQPARVIHYQDALQQLEGNPERNSLGMSWAVVSDGNGGKKTSNAVDTVSGSALTVPWTSYASNIPLTMTA